MSRDHRNLKAFQLADRLVLAVYRLARRLPDEERYGLGSQMRRATVSVAANIVEGCARQGQQELLHFLNISFGSLRELGYLIGLRPRLGYVDDAAVASLNDGYEQTCRVLSGLITSLRQEPPNK